MIQYDFFEHEKLLIIKYSGELQKSEMIGFLHFMQPEATRKSVENILNDLRSVKFNFSVSELEAIAKFRADYLRDTPIKQNAVHIVTKAMETSFSTLFQHSLQGTGVNISVCSTMEYAIGKLGLQYSPAGIEDKIKNLSNTFNF